MPWRRTLYPNANLNRPSALMASKLPLNLPCILWQHCDCYSISHADSMPVNKTAETRAVLVHAWYVDNRSWSSVSRTGVVTTQVSTKGASRGVGDGGANCFQDTRSRALRILAAPSHGRRIKGRSQNALYVYEFPEERSNYFRHLDAST